jgi:hypothetical protein
MAESRAPTGGADGSASKIAQAIAILWDHPEWTDKEIAAAAGCSPEHLCRNDKYQAARAAMRDYQKSLLPRAKQHRGSDMDEYGEA